MKYTQTVLFKNSIQKYVVIFCAIFISMFLFSVKTNSATPVPAPEIQNGVVVTNQSDDAVAGWISPIENSNSSSNGDSVPQNGEHNFGPKYIHLREPLLPGKNSIDVSPDTTDSIGIMSAYVTMIYKYVLALGSIVAVLVVMFGGIKMMTSGGDSGATTEAKDMILQTLSGLAMLFLTGLFLYAINPNFFIFSGDSNAHSLQNPSTASNNSPAVAGP